MNSYDEAFHEWNTNLLFTRLRMTSLFLLMCYPFFLYVDLVLLKDVGDPLFCYTLTGIHTAGFLLSIVFLLIYKRVRQQDTFMRSIWPTFLVLVYIACYIGGGALSSLNSHRLTGNIDSYVIILIGVAAIFPLRPQHFASIIIPCHALFLYFLTLVTENDFTLHSKQINTTLTVCISFFILLTFYSYKKKDFLHQCKQKEANENLRKLFDINPYPLILSRLDDGRILLANERAQKEWPLEAEGGPQYDTRYVFHDAEDRAAVTEQLQKTGCLKNHVLQQMTAPGFTRWAMVNYETVEINHVRCILSGVTDITELKKVEGELAKHASIDLLTGQRNRRSGMEALAQMFAESRNSWVECTLCFIDINNLKQVNDQYGHREGDALITTVCNVVAAKIGPEDILFRYGGDEFIVLFFHKSTEAAEAVWTAIWQELSAINAKKEKPYPITSSHGMFYFCSGMDVTIEDMIEAADAAMYKEKTSRKKQLSDNSDSAGSSLPLVH